MAVWAVSQNQRYGAAVSHTYEVSQEIAEFRMLSERAETGRRGLLLTGQKRFLDVYDESLQPAGKRLDQIEAMTRDNPAQQKRVERLRTLTALQLSLFSEALSRSPAASGIQAAREFGLNSSPEVVFAIRRWRRP